MIAGATSTFGLFAGALLLPRYFQQVRDVSATHSGLLIYPLLLGLLVVGQRRRHARSPSGSSSAAPCWRARG